MIGIFAAHLWQSTLFAGMAALLTLAFRANKAQVRYRLWLIASYKFLIPFALLTSLGRHIPWTPSSIREIATATPSFTYTVERFSQPFPQNPLPVSATFAHAWINLVVPGMWLCGVIFLGLIRLRKWRAIRLVVRASVPTKISAPVEVRTSPGLPEPGVVGWLRPVLLLPHGIAERLTPSEMNAILAHELSHVRRRDNLLACVHMAVETIFWFHPLVWWIGARLLDERECACDEEVVNQGNQPDIYAEAILNVCKLYVKPPLVCVSGVTGSDLRRRIEAIMKDRRVVSLSVGKKLALGITGVLAFTAPVVIGVLNAVGAQEIPDWQTKAGGKLAFEVASVKLSAGRQTALNVPLDAGDRYTPTGGLFRADVPLWSYIQFAYKLWWPAEDQRKEIDRLPKWVTNDRYSIEARAAGNPTKDQYRLMVRSLLADRFKLAAHFETHHVPVLALTLAKAGKLGPKLIAHADGRACGDPTLSPGPVPAGLFGGDQSAGPENFPPLVRFARPDQKTQRRHASGLPKRDHGFARGLAFRNYQLRAATNRSNRSQRKVRLHARLGGGARAIPARFSRRRIGPDRSDRSPGSARPTRPQTGISQRPGTDSNDRQSGTSVGELT
jgi:beta-lactamase regulating signal transducer with metallopeptidase domain